MPLVLICHKINYTLLKYLKFQWTNIYVFLIIYFKIYLIVSKLHLKERNLYISIHIVFWSKSLYSQRHRRSFMSLGLKNYTINMYHRKQTHVKMELFKVDMDPDPIAIYKLGFKQELVRITTIEEQTLNFL